MAKNDQRQPNRIARSSQPAPGSPSKDKRRRALVDDHMAMAHIAARAVFRSIRGAIELDDLIAFATVGLLQAAARYDETKGATFASFAYQRVRGAIFDGLREIAPLPSAAYRTDRASASSSENPNARPRLFVTSLDAYIDAGYQVPDPTSPSAEQNAQHSELCGLLRSAIAGLSERERALILAHYFHGKPLKSAGSDLGISKSWASRLHAQAICSLRTSMAPARLAA